MTGTLKTSAYCAIDTFIRCSNHWNGRYIGQPSYVIAITVLIFLAAFNECFALLLSIGLEWEQEYDERESDQASQVEREQTSVCQNIIDWVHRYTVYGTPPSSEADDLLGNESFRMTDL